MSLIKKLQTIEMSGKDLIDFIPILKHYEKDSAPFITTGIVSSVDPDLGIVGRGIHRMEYRGRNFLGIALLNPPLTTIYQKYKSRGQRNARCNYYRRRPCPLYLYGSQGTSRNR